MLDEVDAAWERAVQLAAQDLELHFARDEVSGRPIVELRTLSGELVKRISAAQALQIIAGRAPERDHRSLTPPSRPDVPSPRLAIVAA